MLGAAIGLISAVGAFFITAMIVRIVDSKKERKKPCCCEDPHNTYQWLLQHNFSDGDAYEAVVQMTRDGLFGQEEKDKQLAADIENDKYHAAAIKASILGLPYYPRLIWHYPEDEHLIR